MLHILKVTGFVAYSNYQKTQTTFFIHKLHLTHSNVTPFTVLLMIKHHHFFVTSLALYMPVSILNSSDDTNSHIWFFTYTITYRQTIEVVVRILLHRTHFQH